MWVFAFLTTKNAWEVVIFVNPILRQSILSLLACVLLTAWYGHPQRSVSVKARQDQPPRGWVAQEKC